MDDLWLLDFDIEPTEFLGTPGVRFKCLSCPWSSKTYRKGDNLAMIVNDLYQEHAKDHD